MLTPSALAELTGVSTDTLRHYERKGLLAPVRTSSGYRRYSTECVERVFLIRRALIAGFSLSELSRVLAERERGGVPCASVRASVQARLNELEDTLQDLHLLKLDLLALLKNWDAKLAATPKDKQARLLDHLIQPHSLSRDRNIPDLATPRNRRKALT
jgi:DNA-binding transcriptional MerR regulator